MASIPMRALVAFEHEGVPVRPGDHFEVSAPIAAALRYQGKAQFLTTAVAAELVPPVRKRRAYKRRDLQAEP